MRSGRLLLFAGLGVAASVAWVLSPLTVLFAIAVVPVVLLPLRGLEFRERRVVATIVAAAITIRLLIIAGLFLWTDHASVPFGSFSGDEDYFLKRSVWLVNVARGIPVHPLDLEYAYEPYGRSGHLYMLAAVQALVGPSPYGLRLVSVLLYVLAALVLYRLVRATFGRMPALFGLATLLFLPSLLVWSVSVLKEPSFVLISAVTLLLAFKAVDPYSRVSRRLLAVIGVAVLAAVQQAVRPYGAAFSVSSVLSGLAIGLIAARPRMLLATLVAAPIVIGIVFSRPQVQLKTYVAIQTAARQHWGAVAVSQGHGYRLLDERFYPELNEISGLEFKETVRFLTRGIVAYLTEPLPWHAQSRATVAYLAEQMIWYVLAGLAAAGVLFGFRRNPVVTGLLTAHAAVIGAAVAFTDGNVGTLVRHRGLALPYLVWLSGVGACEALARFSRRQTLAALSVDGLQAPWPGPA